MKKTNAIILAAGLGTRLRPITGNIPKPLIPVCNRPLIENIMLNLKNAGVGKMAVNTHYLPDKMRDFVAKSSFADTTELYHEPDILGTGGPLVNAKKMLSDSDCFLLHNGDILTNIDLSELIEQHRKSGALVTMTLIDGPENKVRINSEGTVVDILDKLEYALENTRKLTYSGIMALSPEIFNFLPPNPVNCSIIKAVIRAIDSDPGTVKAFVPENIYWNDLGTIKQYFQAHEDILFKRIISLPGVDIREDSVLAGANTIISPDCEISGFLCAGDNCQIGEGSIICKCILLDNASIGDGEFRHSEIIGPDFSRHKSFQTLKELKILQGMDLEAFKISSLVEQGSDRGFFRLTGEGCISRVLMHSSEIDEDFERYIEIGRFLSAQGLPTPEIYEIDSKEFCVLMEDLGNMTLYKLTKGNMSYERFEDLYLKTVDSLVEFQVKATEALKVSDMKIREFSLDYLRWETEYFKKNFLENYCGIQEKETAALDCEFDKLAQCVYGHPKILMHRDFQSQNILIQDGNVRLVDFQGARIGPMAYDIMSLSRDPYVKIPEELKNKLTARYFSRFEELGDFDIVQFDGSPDKISREFLTTTAGLQRNMQALGAYAFLSLKKGKKDYLQFIPQGFEYLLQGLEEFRQINDAGFKLDALCGICAKLQREMAQ